MEVKIKEGYGYVNAEWTIEDGVMVVSPKEVKFEPKDGDVVVCDDGALQIFICKESLGGSICSYCMYDTEDNELTFHENISYMIDRPATEEEKKLLFDKLAEEGLGWKADTRELVKLKWKPKEGERYYFPFYSNCYFSSYYADVIKTDFQKALYQNCWVFKTDRECIEFCNRLNDAISQVKP